MLASCTGFMSASPTADPFFKSALPAVIILSLAMNSELYMMLQGSLGHWTHLDSQDATK